MFQMLKHLADPVAAFWIALVILAAFFTFRRRWRLVLWLSIQAGFIYLVAGPAGPLLLAHCERPYAGLNGSEIRQADAIIVLGGGQHGSSNDFFGLDFSEAADRVLAGAELLRLGKAPVLVLGGTPPGSSAEPLANPLHRWLASWGFSNYTILSLGWCSNTHDEGLRANELRTQYHWQSFILVTSAAHLRRAEAVFRHLKLDVIPVACDFEGLTSIHSNSLMGWFPSTSSLALLNRYLYEQIGWWYYRGRHWI